MEYQNRETNQIIRVGIYRSVIETGEIFDLFCLNRKSHETPYSINPQLREKKQMKCFMEEKNYFGFHFDRYSNDDHTLVLNLCCQHINLSTPLCSRSYSQFVRQIGTKENLTDLTVIFYKILDSNILQIVLPTDTCFNDIESKLKTIIIVSIFLFGFFFFTYA